MNTEETVYPSFRLSEVKGDSPSEVPAVSGEGFFRAEIPSAPCNCSEMLKKGYIFADRTLGVEVNLKQSRIDYKKLVRFEISRTDSISEEIIDIALSSFPSDRRFHVAAKPDMKIAEPIIRKWLDDLSEVYVCMHKEHVAGFLGLVFSTEGGGGALCTWLPSEKNTGLQVLRSLSMPEHSLPLKRKGISGYAAE